MMDNTLQRILTNALLPIDAAQEPRDPTLKPAAVLVLLADSDHGITVTFTKRTSRVEHHKGEVSFPGGGYEPADRTLLATALRETFEELGVPTDCVRPLGRLPSAMTRSNFSITPYVGVLTAPVRFIPNPAEVEEAFSSPVSALLLPASKRTEVQTTPSGQTVTTFAYYQSGHRIWGATARILTSFLETVAYLRLEEAAWTTTARP
jgi:8-oxo-dGTP pyrophosphatase MutT (NUDIX family)